MVMRANINFQFRVHKGHHRTADGRFPPFPCFRQITLPREENRFVSGERERERERERQRERVSNRGHFPRQNKLKARIALELSRGLAGREARATGAARDHHCASSVSSNFRFQLSVICHLQTDIYGQDGMDGRERTRLNSTGMSRERERERERERREQ